MAARNYQDGYDLRPVNFTLRQDRPQGFEAGKALKMGLFACSWGCERFYRSRNAVENHSCPGRQKMFQRFVEELRALNLPVPPAYLQEANGTVMNYPKPKICDEFPSSAKELGRQMKAKGIGQQPEDEGETWDLSELDRVLGGVKKGKKHVLQTFLRNFKHTNASTRHIYFNFHHNEYHF